MLTIELCQRPSPAEQFSALSSVELASMPHLDFLTRRHIDDLTVTAYDLRITSKSVLPSQIDRRFPVEAPGACIVLETATCSR
uniref:AraC family transcriptional regulator n=1 Tax=Mesocestoides corti TaxID=53468 RepID=A0A5K3EU05_MESCO